MGNRNTTTYPKPDPEEVPRDWMNRCGLTRFTTPWLDNLSGWTEPQPQFLTYPHRGTFKSEYLAYAYSQIYEGMGDPGWDYPYMGLGYQKWVEMKALWDKYLNIKETKIQKKKIPKVTFETKFKSPFPVPPPHHAETVTSASNQSIIEEIYPNLNPTNPFMNCPSVPVSPFLTNAGSPVSCSIAVEARGASLKEWFSGKGKTPKRVLGRTPDSPLSDDLEDTDDEDDDYDNPNDVGPIVRSRPNPLTENTPFVFSMGPKGAKILPPSVSTLKDLIKMLPSPNKPLDFVDVLIKASRYCQLVGADYRFILQMVLGDWYDEADLIKTVKCLDPKADKWPIVVKHEDVDRGRRWWKKKEYEFLWGNPNEAMGLLKNELTAYLLSRQEARQDLSQVTNCKQEKGETTTKFLERFRETWTLLGGMPLSEADPNPLFLTTFLNNCRLEIVKILKFQLSDRSTMTIKRLGERVRTMEGDGILECKQVECLIQGYRNGKKGGRGGRGRGRGSLQGQSAPSRSGICYYCGKKGHWARGCRTKARGEGRDGQNAYNQLTNGQWHDAHEVFSPNHSQQSPQRVQQQQQRRQHIPNPVSRMQFSRWVEAFPCARENAKMVTRVLAKEIIPRYGVPHAIDSD
ncbi:uncharacterized protein LOC128518262 [Clarias gariepinus]|uniref:uncharacterized protein LOC128518262 n=1 Tax=Clarias gariepinus TaxID=13013 RepID=UPI00234D664B|nr:uncharacterized protein LOC128518262 [Clarias gariepinus]